MLKVELLLLKVELLLNDLAYGLDVASLVRDVLTHDVKLVKQFGSSVLQGVGLADATVGKRVCDNLYALLLKFHVNVLARHYSRRHNE